ncbi:MAG: hypothetical protein RMJ87_08440 [Cytophagales bacterium]|nr:hypothetical protein [Cytophagales bacterium]
MKHLSIGIGLVSLAYLLVLWVIYRGRVTWRLLKRQFAVISQKIPFICNALLQEKDIFAHERNMKVA